VAEAVLVTLAIRIGSSLSAVRVRDLLMCPVLTHASKLRMMKVMGFWRSDVVRGYLYAAPSEMWDAAAKLHECLFG